MRLTRGWQGAAGEDPWGEPPAPIALRWEVVTFREHFNPGHGAGRRTRQLELHPRHPDPRPLGHMTWFRQRLEGRERERPSEEPLEGERALTRRRLAVWKLRW